jgi:predicted DNA-binding transcriptional regulator
MVSKDQSIGGIIFIVCVVVAIFYLATLFYPQWLGVIGFSMGATDAEKAAFIDNARFWIIAVPVFVAFVAVMCIGAWIGWTMATTPPPKPIEEITTEIEEKKEETPTEPQEEAKSAEAPAEEEKKTERKRKS